MDWFNIKEKSAGKKRLIITWKLYKLLGTQIALIIAFFVALITFISNKDIRKYSFKYFETLYNFTKNQNHKPSLLNSFKHTYSYAESLVYKMEAFAGTYNCNKINFTNKDSQEKLFKQIQEKKGILFICNHVGNVEILKTFFTTNDNIKPTTVSIFLQKEHCSIFNNFINTIEKKSEILKIYPIEEIDMTTVSEIDDNLSNGGIVFIAGDRISANNPNKTIEEMLLNKKINLPIGVFKLAQILDCTTYFISCVKTKQGYDILLEEQSSTNLNTLPKRFITFLENIIKNYPFQFYHFYDIFK